MLRKILFLLILSSQMVLGQTKIIAHRGAWKIASLPQNSIASLKEAIRLNCYGSEFDVRMTKDEVLVINHDAHFEGTDIEQSNYAELALKKLKNGENLPTLEQYLIAGKNQNHTKLICEIKPSPAGKERSLIIAEKTYDLVKHLKCNKIVVFISFDYDILIKIKALDKKANTQYLNGDKSVNELKADNINGADYHFSVFKSKQNWIDEAQNIGIETNAWTANDSLTIDYLLAHKINYITTDEPEFAILRAAKPARKLVWSDEFNYTGLPDASKWDYNVGNSGYGNHELQFYTKADTANALVKNGFLTITARKELKESANYTSARLVTAEKKYFKYGKTEARIKLPKGRGTWPAFWMLGKNISDKKIGWPECGEIDIMEQVGYDPDTLVGSLHTKSYNWPMNTQKTKRIFVPNLDDEFHVFAIDWSAEKLDFLVDNSVYLSVKNEHKTTAEWPLDQEFFIILNFAVGGDWGGKFGVDDTIFPQKMVVDYVRVYE